MDTAIEDGEAASSHTNVTTASGEGECAELCRSAVEQGRECWGFTFKDPQCRLHFSGHAHRYALHPGALYFLSAPGDTAYVKICTGGESMGVSLLHGNVPACYPTLTNNTVPFRCARLNRTALPSISRHTHTHTPVSYTHLTLPTSLRV